MIGLSFGLGAFVIPMAMSGIYKATNYRVALDILGTLFSIHAVVFLIYVVQSNCRREKKKKKEEID